MTPISAFYDHILPELRGCTTAMVDLHLLHVAREFCERSSVWRYAWVQPTIAGQATYDVSSPELRSELVRITRIGVNGRLLWDDAWADHRRAPSEEAPRYPRTEPPFIMDDLATELTLIGAEVPTADMTNGLTLTAALKPSYTASQLPDLLKTEHLEAIRVGTLARLMRMGGKPWTDRELAGFYQAEFNRLMNAGATRAQLGNTRQRLRTTTTRI